MIQDSVLQLDGVSKHFGAVRALHKVSLSLHRGEVLGLVGDNGAGKSTLVKILSGVYRPDHGHLIVDGTPVDLHSPAHAQERGIETVFQDLSLIPTLDIAENVFLHRELFGPGKLLGSARRMDKKRMRRQVSDGLKKLEVTLPPLGTKVAALSGGQKQMVAIARAVLWEQKIVLLDEPAAALGVRQTETVLAFVERLKLHGVSVVLISHNMQHVLRVADRVAVMRLGEKVMDKPAADTSTHEIVSYITGAVDGASDSTTLAVLREHERQGGQSQ